MNGKKDVICRFLKTLCLRKEREWERSKEMSDFQPLFIWAPLIIYQNFLNYMFVKPKNVKVTKNKPNKWLSPRIILYFYLNSVSKQTSIWYYAFVSWQQLPQSAALIKDIFAVSKPIWRWARCACFYTYLHILHINTPI